MMHDHLATCKFACADGYSGNTGDYACYNGHWRLTSEEQPSCTPTCSRLGKISGPKSKQQGKYASDCDCAAQCSGVSDYFMMKKTKCWCMTDPKFTRQNELKVKNSR